MTGTAHLESCSPAAGTFLAPYVVLALTGPSLLLLAIGFVLAGVAIGCGETAETTAIALLAPDDVRGSAFGLLAATQSVGNLVASATAGILWTAISPAAAFLFAAGAMLLALAHSRPAPSRSTRPARTPARDSLRVEVDRLMTAKLIALVLPLGLDTFAVAAALGTIGVSSSTRRRVLVLFTALEAGMPLIGLALGAPLGHAIGAAADYVPIGVLLAFGIYTLTGDNDDEG